MTTKKTAPGKEGPRSFAFIVTKVSDGDLERDASAELHELMTALDAEAQSLGTAKGKITVTLSISTDHKGLADVNYTIAVKKPQPKRPLGRMWVTAGGNLSHEKPQQESLPFRTVENADQRTTDEEPAPVRSVP
jgi:hypothetical protein